LLHDDSIKSRINAKQVTFFIGICVIKVVFLTKQMQS